MKIYPITTGMRLHYKKPVFRKFLMVMKLATFLLFITFLQVSAKGFSQITLKESNASLAAVLKTVEKQSGYLFVYNAQQIQLGTVTTDLKNATIEEALQTFFKNKPITYQIVDKNIVLLPKKGEDASLYDRIKDKIKAELQQVVVSGKVQDETGQPLAGVTILVKGNQTGAISDKNGNFSLTVPDENSALTFTFIGFETQELKAKDIVSGSVLVMKASITNLHEIVINKGPYDEKQKFLTGDVGTVTAKEIAQQPIGNVLQALEGKVPGLLITQSTGAPGGSFSVQIRGQNSLGQGTDPLYIIDGVPFESELPFQLLNPQLNGGSPLNYINPYDIEKVEVLKDADATAIYGTRASNGVILITTKKGQAGSMRVNFNMNSGTSVPGRSIQLLNTQQYLAVRHAAFRNDGATPGPGDHDINGDWDTTRYTDWAKVFTKVPAPYINAIASVSGGNTNTQYYISADYNRQGTPYPTLTPGDGKDTKVSTHFSVQSVSPNGRFSINFSGAYEADNNRVQTEDFTYDSFYLPPDAPALFNPDGTLNWQPLSPGQPGTFSNPLADLYVGYKQITSSLVGNSVLRYKILKNFDVSLISGYTNTQNNEVNTFPSTLYDPGYHTTSNSASINEMNTHTYNIEPQLSLHDLKLSKGILNVVVGGRVAENVASVYGFEGSNFVSDELLENLQAAGSGTLSASTTDDEQYRYTSLYARAGYNWEDKYILNITGDRDGSSKFGPGKQFGNFGAVGAAWLFSEEKFIHDNLPFLSFGKLRASYGVTGKEPGQNYLFLNLFNTLQYSYGGGQSLAGTTLLNPDLQWEVDKKLEYGLELGFLKDRINLQVSYYRNRSDNQLVSAHVSSVTGASSIEENLPAAIQNSGVEILLNTVNVKSDKFAWSSAFNISFARNKLLAFPNLDKYGYDYIVGKPLNIVKVYHMVGINDTTGLYQFRDSQGNLTINPSSTTDRTSVIYLDPKYTGGFTNTFRYSGFTLDVFFMFVKQIGKNLFGAYPGFAGVPENIPVAFLNAWQKPGDHAMYERFTQTGGDAYTAFDHAQSSDFAYTDASYIRLKNVALSWELPQKWRKSIGVQSCNIFTHVENLLTFSHYVGVDPESQDFGLPPLRTITFGFQVVL